MSQQRVLVLGGAGFIGQEVVGQLAETDWAVPVVASRSAKADGPWESIAVDTRDQASLTVALTNVYAVVNCVAGEGVAISEGAGALVRAAQSAGVRRIIHMSTMSVYGKAQGRIDESYPLKDDIGWYGHAKMEAERRMRDFAAQGGEVVMLRPGCVIGPGSRLWVDRIAGWLKAGRLGNLGAAGDGPANLVDVRDVAQAAVKALQVPLPESAVAVFNLANPQSPRWNQYFTDLALAIGAIPLKTLGPRRLKLEAYALGIPLKVLERIAPKVAPGSAWVPEGIPPSLLGLWKQQIQLDSAAATEVLKVEWTIYFESIINLQTMS